MSDPSLTGSEDKSSFDAIIACGLYLHDALIGLWFRLASMLQVEVFRMLLRKKSLLFGIAAQQLRSAEVFEGWSRHFTRRFGCGGS